jgi:IclR family transcriptional regulator, pca regulon regulatory protein
VTGARPERDADFVQSLERGLAVICAFDRDHAELTLSEVAASTGVTRATARRFLLTLQRLGYVRSDGRFFSLTPRVLELGYAFLSGMSLPEVAEPHLEALVAEVNESTSVSVLDGGDVIYVARVPVSRIMTVAISVGTRFPAYATSMGRVLLAALEPADLETYLATVRIARHTPRTVASVAGLRTELAKVRSQGYAIVDQELEEGLRAVAAPIRDRSGQVIASVNVSTHAGRTSLESVRRNLVPPLLAAAARITADLPTSSRARP